MRFVNGETFVLFMIFWCSFSAANRNDTDGEFKEFIVTWALPNSNNPAAFTHMPRTTEAAVKQGCKELDDGCKNSSLNHVGIRYVCNDSVDALLIFDPQGTVAGIQMAVLKEIADHAEPIHYASFPSTVEETIMGKQYYVVTTYFMEPKKVCEGRSKQSLEIEGTVSSLHFQNGTDPIKDSTTAIDLHGNNETLFNERWIEGKCVPTMGLHYYYELSDDMCSKFCPYFRMYDETSSTRRMTGFGYLVFGNYSAKPRYELIPEEAFIMFVKRLPKCLHEGFQKSHGLTSFHVFFEEPSTIGCNKNNSTISY